MNRNNYSIEDLINLKRSGSKIYCFGAGRILSRVLNAMGREFAESIFSVVDNNSDLWGTLYEYGNVNIPIISPAVFVEKYDDNDILFITSIYTEQILVQLSQFSKLNNMDYCEYDIAMRLQNDYARENKLIPSTLSLHSDMRIPKIIHYCWFGPDKIPDEYRKYMDSWSKYCPDYEIKEWNEDNFDVYQNEYVRDAYIRGKYAFVSDFARLDVVERFGGVYLDCDVELVKNLDILLCNDMFCGFESNTRVNFGLGYGAIAHHPYVRDLRDDYRTRPFVLEDGTLNLVPCPVYQTEYLNSKGLDVDGNYQILEKAIVLPEIVLSGKSQDTFKIIDNKDNTFSIHHFAASWNDQYLKAKEEIVNKINNRYSDTKSMGSDIPYGKYQIWECIDNNINAGGKAPKDIKDILEKEGYHPINVHSYNDSDDIKDKWNNVRNNNEWDYCYERIEKNSILVLQHPFWNTQKKRNETLIKLKNDKNVKIISFVHDVEKLRKSFWNESMKEEYEFMLNYADILVVHNDIMKDFFVQEGFKEQRIVVIGIFDYLADGNEPVSGCSKYHWNPEKIEVSVAGNLDSLKSSYLVKLKELQEIYFHLYGANYKGIKKDELIYHGSFSPIGVLRELYHGFGLVWDGEDINTCMGNTGNYLRYNNPHKLSLYLAAGIPVIVWKESAEAKPVLDNELGIAVSSLYELKDKLSDISQEEYCKYKERVCSYRRSLLDGENTKSAIGEAEKILRKNNE